MGKAFFTGWATWEKLVFILACAIVMTVLLGCAKLIWTHRKLRKYGGVAEKDRREQAVYRQMSQRRNPQRRTDVPFGIRAIESGIEVEGVWISRSNTPEPASSAQTSAPSTRRTSDIVVENQATRTPHARSRSTSSTRIAMGSTGTGSGEAPKTAGRHHPPLAYARYSSNPVFLQQSSIASTAAETEFAGSVDSRNSSRSGSDINVTEPTCSPEPRSQRPQQRQHSTELELMHTHRMSQAAETGQLTPRVRIARQGISGDWTGVPQRQRNSTASDIGNYQRARARSQSPVARPATAAGSSSNSLNSPPSIDSLSAAARRSSLPDVTPFAQFCRTAPILPQSELRQSMSGTADRSAMQQVSDSLAEYMITSSSAGAQDPVRSSRSEEPFPKAVEPASERVLFEKRGTEVLRGHGSGFEILRPGTLSEAADRQRSVPPLSLYNHTARPRSESDGSGRKLQKKRRPSADSQRSSSGSRWSRGSML